MAEGRRAGGTSDGDEKEGAWRGTSFHADQHGQPGVDVLESRPMAGSRRARCASDGDEKEGAWGGTSRHADQYGQSCFHLERAGSTCGGSQIDEGVYAPSVPVARRRSLPYSVFVCSIE